MAQPLTPEELGAILEAIDREPTGKLSELAKIAGLSLAEDYIGVDLSGEDLSKDNLSNANLSLANLSNANLSLANLSNTNLSNANLSNANLRGANLSNANLRGANLSNANLRGADLRSTVIDEKTKLSKKWRLVREIATQSAVTSESGEEAKFKDIRIVDRFSSFYQVEPALHAIPDRQLKINMNRLVKQYPQKNENFWVVYWLEAARNGTDSLAKHHLTAYLEPVCLQCARNADNRFSIPEYTLLDYFQIAREAASHPLKILKNYNAELGSPNFYAELKIKSVIRSFIGKFSSISSWKTLRYLSQKALKTALQRAGVREPQLSRCVLAWQGFKVIYKSFQRVGNPGLFLSLFSTPTDGELADIAAYYNECNKGQFLEAQEYAVTDKEIMKLLKTCIKAVKLKWNNKIKLDSIDDNDPRLVFDSFEGQQWEEEEQAIYSKIGQKVKRELSKAIGSLPPRDRVLIVLHYGLEVDHSIIGKEFGLKNIDIFQRLKISTSSLAENLVQWREKKVKLNLGRNQIFGLNRKLMSKSQIFGSTYEVRNELKQYFRWYCKTEILYRFLQKTLRDDPLLSEEIPLLRCYYGVGNLSTIVNAKTEVQEKLAEINEILQIKLQGFMETEFNLNPSFISTIDKFLAELIDTWLRKAQWAILEMESDEFEAEFEMESDEFEAEFEDEINYLLDCLISYLILGG